MYVSRVIRDIIDDMLWYLPDNLIQIRIFNEVFPRVMGFMSKIFMQWYVWLLILAHLFQKKICWSEAPQSKNTILCIELFWIFSSIFPLIISTYYICRYFMSLYLFFCFKVSIMQELFWDIVRKLRNRTKTRSWIIWSPLTKQCDQFTTWNPFEHRRTSTTFSSNSISDGHSKFSLAGLWQKS